MLCSSALPPARPVRGSVPGDRSRPVSHWREPQPKTRDDGSHPRVIEHTRTRQAGGMPRPPRTTPSLGVGAGTSVGRAPHRGAPQGHALSVARWRRRGATAAGHIGGRETCSRRGHGADRGPRACLPGPCLRPARRSAGGQTAMIAICRAQPPRFDEDGVVRAIAGVLQRPAQLAGRPGRVHCVPRARGHAGAAARE